MTSLLGAKSRQPAVVPVFFLTEMWERFGFYMIQSLLVLYMTTSHFGFSDTRSYATLGAFSALSYVMPIIGGYFASRILDYEHAIILGGILLASGYALLGLHNQSWFYIALAVLATGNGFFKPNISSYLGNFYQPHDSRREKGYTLFYVGINIGTFLSTSSAGFIVRHFGWHTPYLIASAGLCIGTLTFIIGLLILKHTGRFYRVQTSSAQKSALSISLVYLNAIAFALIAYEIIAHTRFANDLMLSVGCIVFAGLIFHSLHFKKAVKNKLLACIFLILISILFWAIYFQMFLSMNLYIDRAVDRHFFHFKLPTPIFIALQSIFIIILGPIFANLWQKLAKKNINPSIPTKFTLSLFMLTITFILAFIGTRYPNSTGQTNKYFIIFAYFFLTIGELLLSPVGLTMVTVLSPSKMTGLMMGVWFVALGLGIKLGGFIADYAAIPKYLHNVHRVNAIYGHAFLLYAIVALTSALLCLVISPFLNTLIDKKQGQL